MSMDIERQPRDLSFAALDQAPGRSAWQGQLVWWGWLCCAAALAFAQASSTSAYVLVGAFLLISALYPDSPYRAVRWSLLPWVVVIFGGLSIAWSEMPMASARAAVQIAITTLVAIMFAQGLRARTFIAILMYAVLASAVAFVNQFQVFGSKNSVALAFTILLLSSVWVLIDPRQSPINRLVALGSLVAGPPMLLEANSEGALLAGGMAIVCSVAPFLLRSLAPRTRTATLFIATFIAILAIAIAFAFFDNLYDVMLTSMGKDSSLTGRTLLWSRAGEIIAAHPWGGVGLQAFWYEGNADAERFWSYFYIYSHRGFHFHNLWLETGVELGLFGILIVALTTLRIAYNIVRWALRDPTPESCFFLGFLTFVLVRTFGEVELYVQFSLVPVVFVAGYYYAATADTRPASPAHPFGRYSRSG
jgi:exopolysaccharide production protein ExoQ